jgi:hypothetical protein
LNLTEIVASNIGRGFCVHYPSTLLVPESAVVAVTAATGLKLQRLKGVQGNERRGDGGICLFASRFDERRINFYITLQRRGNSTTGSSEERELERSSV